MTVVIPAPAIGAEPTPPTQRIDAVDIIRGFALGGILLANVHLMSGASAVLRGDEAARVETAAVVFERIFVDKSFFPLFSLLFGLGLALQMQRTTAHGQVLIPLYRRRLLVLLAIALLHWFLVWDAFILINYAVLGFVLLLFRHRSSRSLLIWVAVCLACSAATPKLTRWADRAMVHVPAAGALIQRQQADQRASARTWFRERQERLKSGSYAIVVTERTQRFGRVFARPQQYYPWAYGGIFAMFLLGLYIGRRGVLRDVDRYLPLFRVVLWSGLIVGIAAKTTALGLEYSRASGGSAFYVAYGLQRIGGPILAFGYAAALVILCQQSLWRRRLATLAAAGRMALTNYLLQSLICTTIFYGYGLGLYRRVGVAHGLGIAAGVWALQMLASSWWLQRYQFGPAEWLWRSLTYGRLQPFVAQRPTTVGRPTPTIASNGVIGR